MWNNMAANLSFGEEFLFDECAGADMVYNHNGMFVLCFSTF